MIDTVAFGEGKSPSLRWVADKSLPFHSYGELAAQRPTGRTRYRRGWFRQVLQVEIISPMRRFPAAPPPPGIPYDPWALGSYTFWRDARATDVFEAVTG